MEGLLHRRQQLLHHRALAEVDLGHHLHARSDRVAATVAFEVLLLEVDEGAEGERAGGAVAAGKTAETGVGVGCLGGVGAQLGESGSVREAKPSLG